MRDKNCLAAILALRHQGVSFDPLGHPVGHSLGQPIFGDTLGDTSGLKGPGDSCSRPADFVVFVIRIPVVLAKASDVLLSGSEKGVFWKRSPFRKVHFLEILENLEILEILEKPQTEENKGESGHFLEILENVENLEILEIPPVKRPLS